MAEQFGQPAASQRSWDLWPKDVPFQMQPVSPIYYEVHFENAIRHLLMWQFGSQSLATTKALENASWSFRFGLQAVTWSASILAMWKNSMRRFMTVGMGNREARLASSESERMYGASILKMPPGCVFATSCIAVKCRFVPIGSNWDFGFLTGAATFPYVDGQRDQPIEVRLSLPAT